MSYREKFAWLSLIAMAAYIPYFMIAAKLPAGPLPDFRRLDHAVGNIKQNAADARHRHGAQKRGEKDR
jgi:hypothetical protein